MSVGFGFDPPVPRERPSHAPPIALPPPAPPPAQVEFLARLFHLRSQRGAMRGLQIQGARREPPSGVLDCYVEEGGRPLGPAQRSRCGPIARRSRLLVKHPG